VEFVVLGLLLLVPVVYLVIAMGRLQAAAFAVEGSAREAARAFARAPDDGAGTARALTAVRLGLEDQGFDTPAAEVLRLSCDAQPCLRPEGRVTASVELEVVLPGVPAVVDAAVPTRVTVRSEHVAVVDRFRASPRADRASDPGP